MSFSRKLLPSFSLLSLILLIALIGSGIGSVIRYGSWTSETVIDSWLVAAVPDQKNAIKSRFLMVSVEGIIQTWESRSLVRQAKLHRAGTIGYVFSIGRASFSPDGTRVAGFSGGDVTVQICSMAWGWRETAPEVKP